MLAIIFSLSLLLLEAHPLFDTKGFEEIAILCNLAEFLVGPQTEAWDCNNGTLPNITEPWPGVTLDGNNAHVTALRLDLVVGTIPTFIGKLVHLTVLWIRSSQVSGTLPTELALLSQVSDISIGVEGQDGILSGTLPTELATMTSLNKLNLAYNSLEGTIFSGIGNLTRLQSLYLFHNKISGTIPSEIGFTQIWQLMLHKTQLSGTIPTELFGMPSLVDLVLHDTYLEGTIPKTINSRIAKLELQNTLISGTLPTELGRSINLIAIYAENSRLSGTIPTEIFAAFLFSELYALFYFILAQSLDV